MSERDVVWPAEAAELSGATLPTLRRWAAAGRVWSTATAGGHHRYDRAEMAALRDVLAGMTTSEVAALFHVDIKTPTAWVKHGRIAARRTPGGQLRYRREDVEELRGKGGRSDAR